MKEPAPNPFMTHLAQGQQVQLLQYLLLPIQIGYVLLSVLQTCLFVLKCKILYTFFPETQKQVIESRRQLRPQRMWESMKTDPDWGRNFFASFEMIKERYLALIQDPFREARMKEPAPNPFMIELGDGKQVQLLQTAKIGRPFVLNFGSCT